MICEFILRKYFCTPKKKTKKNIFVPPKKLLKLILFFTLVLFSMPAPNMFSNRDWLKHKLVPLKTTPGKLVRNNTPVPKPGLFDGISDDEDSGDETDVITDDDVETTEPYSAADFDSDDDVCIGPAMPGFTRPELYPKASVITIDFSDEDDEEEEETPPPMMLKKKVVKRKKMGDDTTDDEDSDDEDSGDRPKKVVKRKEAPTGTKPPAAKKQKGNNQGHLVQRYCFTFNNPSIEGEDFAEFLKEECPDVKLAVFQKEKGADGTEHFQGYMELKKRMFTTGVVTMLEPYRMHLEHAKGSKLQNFNYCTKGDTRVAGPWYVNCDANECTRKSGNQGKRSDLDNFAKMVKEEGGVTEAVIDAMPGHALAFGKHAKNLVSDMKRTKIQKEQIEWWQEQYQKMINGEEYEGQQQRNLVLYFGPTAVGKTTKVKMNVMGRLGVPLFEKAAKTKWWDGYDDEDHVLIDEMGENSGFSINEFKALTNKGGVTIEMKGTSGVLIADNMYVTSNWHPSYWWKRNENEYHDWNSADYKAIMRRFAEVHWWNDDEELTILKNPGPRQDNDEWRRATAKWLTFWEWHCKPGYNGPTGGNRYSLE